MRVVYREQDVTTVLPGGYLYSGPRGEAEVVAFCCEAMERAWSAMLMGVDETDDRSLTIAIYELLVEREAAPRMVQTRARYPIRFCPFCGERLDVERL